MRKPTIKDIAAKAGVSTATVSRVINKSGNVQSDIAQRVLNTIEEMNYIPNSTAKNLKTNSTNLISFIVSDISNNYFSALADTVENEVYPAGYNLIIFNTNRNKEREEIYLKVSLSNNVAGIIINSTGKNDSLIARISQQIPTLSISRKINSDEYAGDFIDSDNYTGAYKLAEHLIEYGHTRIAVINGDRQLSTGIERARGFCEAMAAHELELDPDYVYHGDFTQNCGYIATEYFCHLTPLPTAIIAMNNSMAIGAMEYLLKNQHPVPQEISLACYGDINNLPLLSIQPSYVSLNPVVIGRKGAQLIMRRITTQKNIQSEIILEPLLNIGTGVRQL